MSKLIVKDPQIQFGYPTIKGTRITVDTIQGLARGGEPIDLIARLYEITEEQVKACIEYENEADKAWRNFLFEFGYAIGAIWVINRIPWIQLKPQFQKRLDAKLKGE